jgi:2-aminoethylphosphonate-pyruvate transaminase
MAEHPECDAMVFTSNKCLEGMPGLGFAVCEMERALAAQGRAGSWGLDLGDVAAHALRSGWGSFRFTPPAQAIRAFGVALRLYAAEGGQPARLARYERNAAILYEGLGGLGLVPYLERHHQGPIIVTVHQPRDPGFELKAFVEALKRRGVLISNFHTTPGPTIRIGAIGHVQPEQARWAVEQVGAVLEEMGVRQREMA